MLGVTISTHYRESRGNELELPLFDIHTIRTATNNFSEDNKLGEGGFGPVYKVIFLTIGHTLFDPPIMQDTNSLKKEHCGTHPNVAISRVSWKMEKRLLSRDSPKLLCRAYMNSQMRCC